MGIAHVAGVGAALDDPAGEARHAANVRTDGGVLYVVGLFQVQSLPVHGAFYLGDVDAAGVFTLNQAAKVLPRDAARIVLAGEGAGEGAVDDLSALLIDSRNAAYAVLARNRPGKGAVGHGAAVAAHNAPQNVLPAGGIDGSRDGQIFHAAPGLDVAKQAAGVPASGDGQSGDGVSLPVKGPAEGGNGGKAASAYVHVAVQHHRFSLGPAVQSAGLGQGGQVAGRLDMDGISPL